jgi:hypothetical protein
LEEVPEMAQDIMKSFENNKTQSAIESLHFKIAELLERSSLMLILSRVSVNLHTKTPNVNFNSGTFSGTFFVSDFYVMGAGGVNDFFILLSSLRYLRKV